MSSEVEEDAGLSASEPEGAEEPENATSLEEREEESAASSASDGEGEGPEDGAASGTDGSGEEAGGEDGEGSAGESDVQERGSEHTQGDGNKDSTERLQSSKVDDSVGPAAPRRLPGPVETLVEHGNTKFVAGAHREAATLYRRALSLTTSSRQGTYHEDYISCLLNIGETYLRLEGEESQANAYLGLAMEKVRQKRTHPHRCADGNCSRPFCRLTSLSVVRVGRSTLWVAQLAIKRNQRSACCWTVPSTGGR